MPKVKRIKKRHPSVNWKRGLTPWSFAEYQEVLQGLSVRTSTPGDNGNRGEEEKESDLFSLHAARSDVIYEKYGHDLNIYMAHMMRFDKIHEFIQRHRGVLIETGIIKNGSDDTTLVSNELLEALCVLPYSKRIRAKGYVDYVFSYSEVMEKCGGVKQGVPSKH